MGGNAFAAYGDTIRLPSSRAAPIAEAVSAAVGAIAVPWNFGKADHGDVDLVVPSSVVASLGDPELAARAAAAVGVAHVAKRPDARDPILFVGLRVPEGIFQVDLISSPDHLAPFTARYLAWGDLGSMIGRTAREMGLSFGMSGLVLPLRVPNAERGSLLLTADPDEAIDWLGFDAARHRAGFRDDFEGADFLAAGRYFDPKVYAHDRATSDARRRGRKRPGRNPFTDYATSLPGRYAWPDAKGDPDVQAPFVAAALERFGKAEAHAEAVERLRAQAVPNASAFTPAALIAATGATMADIRPLAAVMMEEFPEDGAFPAWKASCAPDDLARRARLAWAILCARRDAKGDPTLPS